MTTTVKTRENILTLNQKLSICLPLPKSQDKSVSDENKARVQVLLMDLSELGFKVDRKMLSILKKYNASELRDVHDFLIRELLVIKGGHVQYVPLFLSFPHRIPNDISYLLQRFLPMHLTPVNLQI